VEEYRRKRDPAEYQHDEVGEHEGASIPLAPFPTMAAAGWGAALESWTTLTGSASSTFQTTDLKSCSHL